MNSPTSTAAWRRLTATIVGAGALAFGGMTLLAPAALAEPKTEAQTECGEAGGDYSSESDGGGNRFEKCCYEGMMGVTHCDVWVNGVWNDDLSFLEEPGTPPTTPGGPPRVTPKDIAPVQENPPVKPGAPVVVGQLPAALK